MTDRTCPQLYYDEKKNTLLCRVTNKYCLKEDYEKSKCQTFKDSILEEFVNGKKEQDGTN